MLQRTRLIKLASGTALVFLGMAIVQALPAQDRGLPGRMRLNLPPPNTIPAVKNAGSLFGVTPASPVAAPSLGQPVLVTGAMGQQGQLGQLGCQLGGSLGSLGGRLGSFGGSLGSFGGSLGGSLGSFGGSLGSFGGSLGSFGGGSLGAL